MGHLANRPVVLHNFKEYDYLMSLDKETKMVSERLKNAIEEAGITGVEMELATSFL